MRRGRVIQALVDDGLAFGDLLRHYRVAARLTQESLAERARLSVREVSGLERGARRAAYRGMIPRLSEALVLSAAQRAECRQPAVAELELVDDYVDYAGIG
jgi:transcriptional regulator with XRE-family HTH domain